MSGLNEDPGSGGVPKRFRREGAGHTLGPRRPSVLSCLDSHVSHRSPSPRGDIMVAKPPVPPT